MSSVSLISDIQSPQLEGVNVVFSASASGGNSSSYEYQYLIRGPVSGEEWKIVQKYSSKPTYTWDTEKYEGTNEICVYAREMGSQDAFQSYRNVKFDIYTSQTRLEQHKLSGYYTNSFQSSSSFVCTQLDEILVLSNGDVTTCCADIFGRNAYANIYKHDFKEIINRFRDIRRRLVKNPDVLPQCRTCYELYLKLEKSVLYFHINLNATKDEVRDYLQRGERESYLFIIEPTASCTLACIGCVLKTQENEFKEARKNMFLDFDRFQSWIGPDLDKVGRIRLYNLGEPFLHPKTIDFCSFVKQQSSSTEMHIATNGMPLNTHEKRVKIIESGVEVLYFSIHGSCQESTQRYMTGKFRFGDILEILRDLAIIRRELNLTKPELVWKYVLFEWNDTDEHILRAKYLAREVGVDSILFTLTNGPSPSKRFTSESDDWKRLTQDTTDKEGYWTASWNVSGNM